jgi:hypothetical protein
VLTPEDDDCRGIADPLLLDRATELGRPLFSQDRHLLIEARKRQQAGVHFAGVLYANQLQATIGDCVRALHLIAEVMDGPGAEAARKLIAKPVAQSGPEDG